MKKFLLLLLLLCSAVVSRAGETIIPNGMYRVSAIISSAYKQSTTIQPTDCFVRVSNTGIIIAFNEFMVHDIMTCRKIGKGDDGTIFYTGYDAKANIQIGVLAKKIVEGGVTMYSLIVRLNDDFMDVFMMTKAE